MIEPASVLDFRFRGLVHALVIIGAWAAAVGVGLYLVPVRVETVPIIIPLVLVIAFLYTGLFITAHDAMHGTLLPRDPAWNDWIGRFCVFVFALFSYRMLREKHQAHHRTPASANDPDYHDGRHSGFMAWYVHFMLEYVTVIQIVGMGLVFCFLWLGTGAHPENVILFWALPAILSTLQLFTFGTYLPHREPLSGYANPHRAHSCGYPRWLSFLTCYHFGRHYEHHAWPYIPWWTLGRIESPPLQPSVSKGVNSPGSSQN